MNMKRAAVLVLALSLASVVMAELRPGVVVSSGAPFPVVADFNGDGLDDLVQERNVILNNGTSLHEVRALPFEGERVTGVLDVNGDGRLDLLTEGTPVLYPVHLPQPPVWQGPGYRLYIADEARTFSTAIDISTLNRPYVADVDADGMDDFVVMANVSVGGFPIATDVIVLRSRGDGTFDRLEPFRIAASPQMSSNHRVLSGDLNHDGIPDLVVRCVQDLVVMLGTGGGTFAVTTRHLPSGATFGSHSARLGDVDGDSNPDVVIPAMRGIRVFFGDGRGNFPRTTRASIAKLHEIELPPDLAHLNTKGIMEPRNLALGHFTRNDRMQIAAGTLEGDVVVFSYEQGALRETSRTRTEFWHTDVRTGSFREGAGDDLYVTGTFIWGENWPRSRLFYGSDDIATASTAAPPAARRRATRSAERADVTLQMQMRGDCIDEAAGAAAQWRFTREGLFGSAKRGETAIEAVFDAPNIYFRLTAPYAKDVVIGVLTEANGVYSGTTQVLTDCGYKVMTINAKME